VLGQSQPAVSHHLGLLRMAGLIEPRRAGKHNFYHLLMAPFEQLLELWFAGTPPEERRLRLAEYVLSHAPAPLPATPTSTIVVATTAPA
jgi:ArsR family transcriptional regulator, arsenate/arsenite/antimonite-responsive transcriptional repressor